MRISLSEADFRDLVAGRTVRKAGRLVVALDDIGWERMIFALGAAMAERGVAPEYFIRMLAPPRAPNDCD